MLRFYGLRLLKDYLGHAILLGLPIFFVTILTYINSPDASVWPEVSLFISIGFMLMFQLFGGAYTFEGLHDDFMTAKKDRLKAAPIEPVKLVITQISFCTLMTFVQTLIVLVFTIVLFGADFVNLPLVISLFFLSALAAQLLGGVLLFIFKSSSKAQIAITLYAIFAPMLAGFNFELPTHRITHILTRYSTPLALTKTGIFGVIEGNTNDVILGFISLLVFIGLLMFMLKKLSKEVIV